MTDGEKTDRNYVYIARCADGTLYTGWTNDLEKRVAAHNGGAGAKYTRGRTPVEVVHYEEFASRDGAMRREAEIKKLTRKQKTELLNNSKISR